jgi:thiol-disulfide isomerase/thioredoxin
LKRNAFVFVVLFIAIMAMLAGGKYLSRARKHGPLRLVGDVKGVQAPDFTLLTLDGNKVKLSDYRGKAVLLNFWATWCPPCKVEMPWFEELQKQYGKDGLVVLGVAMDDSEPATIAKFASELGVNIKCCWARTKCQTTMVAFSICPPPSSLVVMARWSRK